MRDVTTTIIATPIIDRPGVFTATLNGVPLCESHQPLCAAARELLRRGVPADAVLILRHAGSGHDALRGRLGALAQLTVEDGPNGRPRLRRWKAPPLWGAAPPARFFAPPVSDRRSDHILAKGGAS